MGELMGVGRGYCNTSNNKGKFLNDLTDHFLGLSVLIETIKGPPGSNSPSPSISVL